MHETCRDRPVDMVHLHHRRKKAEKLDLGRCWAYGRRTFTRMSRFLETKVYLGRLDVVWCSEPSRRVFFAIFRKPLVFTLYYILFFGRR